MNHLGAHKVDGIRSAIEASGTNISPTVLTHRTGTVLVPKLNSCLHAIKACTCNALDEFLEDVIDTVTASKAKGCFTHCDYAFHQFQIRSRVNKKKAHVQAFITPSGSRWGVTT
jgi:hypothetical protein